MSAAVNIPADEAVDAIGRLVDLYTAIEKAEAAWVEAKEEVKRAKKLLDGLARERDQLLAELRDPPPLFAGNGRGEVNASFPAPAADKIDVDAELAAGCREVEAQRATATEAERDARIHRETVLDSDTPGWAPPKPEPKRKRGRPSKASLAKPEAQAPTEGYYERARARAIADAKASIEAILCNRCNTPRSEKVHPCEECGCPEYRLNWRSLGLEAAISDSIDRKFLLVSGLHTAGDVWDRLEGGSITSIHGISVQAARAINEDLTELRAKYGDPDPSTAPMEEPAPAKYERTKPRTRKKATA